MTYRKKQIHIQRDDHNRLKAVKQDGESTAEAFARIMDVAESLSLDEDAESLTTDPEIIKKKVAGLRGAGMTEQAEALREQYEDVTGERL